MNRSPFYEAAPMIEIRGKRRRLLPALLVALLVAVALASLGAARWRAAVSSEQQAMSQRVTDVVQLWMGEHLTAQRAAAFAVAGGGPVGGAMLPDHTSFALQLDADSKVVAALPERQDLQPGDTFDAPLSHLEAVRAGDPVGTWATDQAITDSGVVLATAVPVSGDGVLSIAFDPRATSLPDLIETATEPVSGTSVRVVEPRTGVEVLRVGVLPGGATTEVLTSAGGLDIATVIPAGSAATPVPWPLWTASGLLAALAIALWWRVPALMVVARRGDAAHTALSQSFTPTVTMDTDFTITSANEAMLRLTGYRLDEMLGRNGLDINVDPEDFRNTVPTMVPRLNGTQSVVRECRFNRADGTSGFGRITGDAVHDPGGRHVGYVGQIVDLTELRDTQADLEASQAELKRFSHQIAHDLRGPLIALRGLSELVSSHDLTGERRDQVLAQLHATSGSAVKLVDTMLAAAEQVTTSDVEDVSLSELHEWLERLMTAELAVAGGSLDLDSGLQTIQGPAQVLRVVLANLVSNAIKYRREGVPPRVTIVAEADQEATTLTVIDNGLGVPVDKLDLIFDEGERLGRDDVAGSGHGLAEVRRLIELSGGRCWATANTPHGMRVHLELPAG